MESIMLHPSKNEKGIIVDVTSEEAALYFVTLGWKIVSNVCPPAHFAAGWPCFFIALIMIGLISFFLVEVSAMLCCVMGVKPGVLAITFISVGTAIPDVFASYRGAKMSRFADASIGNLLAVNTVSILFGFGVPWVIGIVYYNK